MRFPSTFVAADLAELIPSKVIPGRRSASTRDAVIGLGQEDAPATTFGAGAVPFVGLAQALKSAGYAGHTILKVVAPDAATVQPAGQTKQASWAAHVYRSQ